MKRLLRPVSWASSAVLAACGAVAQDPTPTDMVFVGGVDGHTSLNGGGIGHICGPQRNGTYWAVLRATVTGIPYVVTISLSGFSGPADYRLTSTGSSTLTLRRGDTTPLEAPPYWAATSGTVTVGSTDVYSGTLTAELDSQSAPGIPASLPAVSMRGRWTCSQASPVGAPSASAGR